MDNPENCFNLIECEKKTGVDPYADANLPHEWTTEVVNEYVNAANSTIHVKTSDQYFEELSKKTKFDFIFIDGLHLKDQVLKDIENARKHLKKGGFIMLHDCLPSTEEMQIENPKPNTAWMGTVWQAFAELRTKENNLEMFTINTDCGLGCLREGRNELWQDANYPVIDWSWEYYITHKNKLMNVVSVDTFLKIL